MLNLMRSDVTLMLRDANFLDESVLGRTCEPGLYPVILFAANQASHRGLDFDENGDSSGNIASRARGGEGQLQCGGPRLQDAGRTAFADFLG